MQARLSASQPAETGEVVRKWTSGSALPSFGFVRLCGAPIAPAASAGSLRHINAPRLLCEEIPCERVGARSRTAAQLRYSHSPHFPCRLSESRSVRKGSDSRYTAVSESRRTFPAANGRKPLG